MYVVKVVVSTGVVFQRGARSEAKAEAAKANNVNEVFMMIWERARRWIAKVVWLDYRTAERRC